MSSCELGAKSMALSYLSDLKTCGTSMGFCRVAMFGMFTLILRTNEKWIPTYCTVTNPKHQWSTRFGPGQIPSDSHICSSSVHLALPVDFFCGQMIPAMWPRTSKKERGSGLQLTLSFHMSILNRTPVLDAGTLDVENPEVLRPHAELRRDGHLGSPIETASFHFWVHQCLKRSWSQFWTTNQVEKPWFQPWFRESDLPSGKLTWLIMEKYFQ